MTDFQSREWLLSMDFSGVAGTCWHSLRLPGSTGQSSSMSTWRARCSCWCTSTKTASVRTMSSSLSTTSMQFLTSFYWFVSLLTKHSHAFCIIRWCFRSAYSTRATQDTLRCGPTLNQGDICECHLSQIMLIAREQEFSMSTLSLEPRREILLPLKTFPRPSLPNRLQLDDSSPEESVVLNEDQTQNPSGKSGKGNSRTQMVIVDIH